MSYAAIENALRAWVKTATGFADGKVIWSAQNGPRPDGPFVALTLGAPVALGQDEITHNFDAGRPDGSKIEHVVRGVRELSLEVAVFDADVVGDASAIALVSKLQTALRLPSVRDALNAAGLSPISTATQNLAAVLGNDFEGRANLDVRFYAPVSASELGTYIETAQVTNLDTGNTFEIP